MTRSAIHHPFSEQGMRDPYPLFAALRRLRPAFYDASMGMWLLTSHELCRAALRDPAFSAAAGQRQRVRAEELPASMLTTDGAEHDRLRTPAVAAFSARSVARRTDEVRAAARALFAAAPPAGSAAVIDLVAELAAPFAERVLGLVTGTDADRWPELGRLAAAASANLNPVLRGEDAVRASTAVAALNDFLARHATDLLHGDGDLTSAERLGILSLIVVGGYEPLADLCATAVALLLDHPAALGELLRTGPELLPAAVDEAMRLESPIPFTARACVSGFVAAGVELPAGAPVLALLGAANRDPDIFDRPDEFDIHRPRNPHLALGGGAHYCLGAALVKQATAIFLGELLATRPAVGREPGTAAAWRTTLVPRGLESLFVSW